MNIKSLQNIAFDKIYEVFRSAFEDYEMQWNKEQFRAMLGRRGFVPELSFGSFQGSDIVSFTLNGVGYFNGKRTAYDTGTGTIKEFRGKGLSTNIFKHSLPFLRKESIEQYLLEVLQHNDKAVSLYQKIGFKINRELNYFGQNSKILDFGSANKNSHYEIKRVDLKAIKALTSFWDFYPSWQNSFESIERKPSDFSILGAFLKGELLGYCAFEANSGDVTQLAVDKEHRRKGVASALFTEASKSNLTDTIKIINTDIDCASITKFLESKNILIKGRQFEMIKEI